MFKIFGIFNFQRQTVIVCFLRMSPKAFSVEELQRIISVTSYFHNHLGQQFTIRHLARRAALSEQKFSEGFYQLYGQAVGEYLHHTSIKSGRFLITHTERSLKEIAGLCGYSDYKSFLKAYKKYFGLTAGTERKQNFIRTN